MLRSALLSISNDMKKQRAEHIDPLRFPNVQAPIEQQMINIGNRNLRMMVVMTTKALVKNAKEKRDV
jgi:hypothetical protein